MEPKDKQLFVDNFQWFNRFFDDLKTLFDKIAEALADEYELSEKRDWQGYYYYKPDSHPSIPRYYMTGLRVKTFSVQVFGILEPSLFKNNPDFTPEPSLVVVKHSRSDRSVWTKNFGLRFIRKPGD